jgi:hypothetical protein
MRMGAHDRAVDEHRAKLWIGAHVSQQPIPAFGACPAAKPHEGGVPVAQFGWQVSPRRTGAKHPQHRFDEQTIVFGLASRVAGFARQQRRDERPLGGSQ